MKWLKPVYLVQLLTGVAGIGAILVADHITKWHILVSAILAVSIIVSLMVVARAESDADRNRARLDTLLRAMELPYFVVKAISTLVKSTAAKRGWQLMGQENFERQTVYHFQSASGPLGRLVVTEQEFKDLWILDDAARARAMQARLFDTGPDSSPEVAEEHAGEVIREAISEHVNGPHWVTQRMEGDGTMVYEVRLDGAAQRLTALKLSKQRYDALLSTPPIRRYEELAEEVERVVPAVLPSPQSSVLPQALS